jgi:snRNA-activating protein complex subunit 3
VNDVVCPSWEHVTLEQLRLALGESIIFSHCNGCCEHRIQLLDTRRVAAVTTALPRELMRMKFRRRRCQICDLANAQQLVMNDRLSDCNPTFMCQMCYELLHYDREGNLLYSDFSVFPYLHDT